MWRKCWGGEGGCGVFFSNKRLFCSKVAVSYLQKLSFHLKWLTVNLQNVLHFQDDLYALLCGLKISVGVST